MVTGRADPTDAGCKKCAAWGDLIFYTFLEPLLTQDASYTARTGVTTASFTRGADDGRWGSFKKTKHLESTYTRIDGRFYNVDAPLEVYYVRLDREVVVSRIYVLVVRFGFVLAFVDFDG